MSNFLKICNLFDALRDIPRSGLSLLWNTNAPQCSFMSFMNIVKLFSRKSVSICLPPTVHENIMLCVSTSAWMHGLTLWKYGHSSHTRVNWFIVLRSFELQLGPFLLTVSFRPKSFCPKLYLRHLCDLGILTFSAILIGDAYQLPNIARQFFQTLIYQSQ